MRGHPIKKPGWVPVLINAVFSQSRSHLSMDAEGLEKVVIRPAI
jgi:hypothetical protein